MSNKEEVESSNDWISIQKIEAVEKIESSMKNTPVNWGQIEHYRLKLEALSIVEEEQKKIKKGFINGMWIKSLSVLLASVILLFLSSVPMDAGHISVSAKSEGIVLKGTFKERFSFNELRFDGYDISSVKGAKTTKSPIESSERELFNQNLSFGRGASLSSLVVKGEAKLKLQILDLTRIFLSAEAHYVELIVSPGTTGACLNTTHMKCEPSKLIKSQEGLPIILKGDLLNIEFDLSDKAIDNNNAMATRNLLKTSRTFSQIAFDEPNKPISSSSNFNLFLDQASLSFLDFGDELLYRRYGQSLRMNSTKGVLSIVAREGLLISQFIGDSEKVKSMQGDNLSPSLITYLWQNKIIALYMTAFFGVFGILYPFVLKFFRND